MHAFRNALRRIVGPSLLCLASSGAWAVGTSGASSSIVFPHVAYTGSFETEVFVTNRHYSSAIQVDVQYFEAKSALKPGEHPCTPLTLAFNETKSFKINTQCQIPDINPDPSLRRSSYGLMILRNRAPGQQPDTIAEGTSVFYAYSRVQHVSTRQGFSLEGFPEHVFSGSPATVAGLKRAEAGTFPYGKFFYQANCFVGSLGDPVNYRIRLVDQAGNNLGTPIVDTLAPFQLFRYVDIFKHAGLPDANEYSNVRADFAALQNLPTQGDPDPLVIDDPAYIGFCTQQENNALDADFRVAKSLDTGNDTQRKLRCRGTTSDSRIVGSCDAPTVANPPTLSIPNAATMHRWVMFVHHPDRLSCKILTVNDAEASKLELQLSAPTATVKAGGQQALEFSYPMPGRQGTYGDGTQTFWVVDVGLRDGVSGPVAYALQCNSGSGIHMNNNPSAVPRVPFVSKPTGPV